MWPTTLTLTGWRQSEPDGGGDALVTANGIGPGSVLSDHPEIPLPEGGCFTFSTTDLDGMTVSVVSADVAFTEFDDEGNYVNNTPERSAVTVLGLTAGELPVDLFADC